MPNRSNISAEGNPRVEVSSPAAAVVPGAATAPTAATASIAATATPADNTPRRARSKRFRRDRIRYAAVGEDITAPALLASAGRLPIRSERAAQVARWFGLRKADDPRPTAEDETPCGGAPTGGDGATARGGGAAPHEKDVAAGSVGDAAEGVADAPRDVGASARTGGGVRDGRGANAAAVVLPELTAGTITFISGPSGAGKSSLLRASRDGAAAERPWIDFAELSPPKLPLVDCFGDALPLRDVLLLLARVGLGEAWSYLRLPSELSEGQRWRLKVALALHAAAAHVAAGAAPVLACDEFAALLDRVTALIVARQLRRAIDALPGAAAVVATAHDDLQPALRPDVIAWCDFGVIEMVQTRWGAERRGGR